MNALPSDIARGMEFTSIGRQVPARTRLGFTASLRGASTYLCPEQKIYPRSLPGLTRQSIFLRKWMDARVKPAHDGRRE
jgi:hypothetical protein